MVRKQCFCPLPEVGLFEPGYRKKYLMTPTRTSSMVYLPGVRSELSIYMSATDVTGLPFACLMHTETIYHGDSIWYQRGLAARLRRGEASQASVSASSVPRSHVDCIYGADGSPLIRIISSRLKKPLMNVSPCHFPQNHA